MTLIDTGPLVASLSPKDPSHFLANELLDLLPFPLETTSACIAESTYLLGRFGGAALQAQLIDMLLINELVVSEMTMDEMRRIRGLILQYENVPMDYADATLIVLAERRRYKSIFTFDSDFRIYPLADGSALEIVPEESS